jgi:hypothetical protein
MALTVSLNCRLGLKERGESEEKRVLFVAVGVFSPLFDGKCGWGKLTLQLNNLVKRHD